MLDHSYLSPHFKSLAKEYQLIYFDQQLSGRSSAEVDSSEVRMSNFIEDIEAFRRELDIGKFHLAGHSWGCLLTMNYAIKYPSKLHSLILMNSMPASSNMWRKEAEILAEKTSEEDSLKREKNTKFQIISTKQTKSY